MSEIKNFYHIVASKNNSNMNKADKFENIVYIKYTL